MGEVSKKTVPDLPGPLIKTWRVSCFLRSCFFLGITVLIVPEGLQPIHHNPLADAYFYYGIDESFL